MTDNKNTEATIADTPTEATTDNTPADTAQVDNTPADTAQVDNTPADTFDRAYVERLRKQSADYRERAKDRDTIAAERDDLAHRLHAELVRADGRLADPADLEFNPAHLDDPNALAEAIANLVATKPGLKARQFGGDVGAGKRGTPAPAPADLIEIIRNATTRG